MVLICIIREDPHQLKSFFKFIIKNSLVQTRLKKFFQELFNLKIFVFFHLTHFS